MYLQKAVIALLSSALLVAAAPAESSVRKDPTLRLIKLSDSDAGTWVREDEKVEKYVSKDINFIDITDIKVSSDIDEVRDVNTNACFLQDKEVLRLLSTPENDVSVAAITYPTTLTHQTEANALIAKVSTTNPQSWLKTLTEYVSKHIHVCRSYFTLLFRFVSCSS